MKLLSAEQQNMTLQGKLREVEQILEVQAARMDDGCKADVDKLQMALEELRADFASREEAISRMKALMASENQSSRAIDQFETGNS